jgi:DNA-binding MurR/RpiR family transcriptional regulator
MTGAPRDYDALVAVLVDRQPALPRRLQDVARFCLNHPEDVAISSIVRLAAEARVPAATITRFAKELGFTGFSDFQQVFRERLLGPRPPYAARLADLRAHPASDTIADADLDDPARVFDHFTTAATGSLLRIGDTLDRAALAAAVATLVSAPVIHIAAARGAFGLATYAYYGLATTGIRAQLIDNLGAMRAEQVAAMGQGDVLLALTFDDYTPETVEIVHLAQGRGQPVVAVTDNELSPIAALATVVLFVKEARLGHFRSQVPALVLLQAMIVSLGRRRR